MSTKTAATWTKPKPKADPAAGEGCMVAGARAGAGAEAATRAEAVETAELLPQL